jgi:hypothetical protein
VTPADGTTISDCSLTVAQDGGTRMLGASYDGGACHGTLPSDLTPGRVTITAAATDSTGESATAARDVVVARTPSITPPGSSPADTTIARKPADAYLACGGRAGGR